MTKILLITGATILYYAVLITLDRKKQKAFKAKQQALMASTTELPVLNNKIEPVGNLLGATEDINSIDFLKERKKDIATPVDPALKLKEDAELKPTIPKNNLMATLETTTDITSIREEETMAFINGLSK